MHDFVKFWRILYENGFEENEKANRDFFFYFSPTSGGQVRFSKTSSLPGNECL